MNAAMTTPQDAGFASASELLDVLYEILASGLEPESATVSVSDIETFLHQHARSPKPRQEIEAFFQWGGLPMRVDAVVRDSGLRLTAVAASAVSAGSGDLRAPESTTGRHSVAVPPTAAMSPVPERMVIDPAPARRSVSGLSIALAGVCLALLCLGLVGAWSVMGLRDELAQSQATQHRTIAVLERVQARTEQMAQQLNAQRNAMAEQRVEVERLVESFFPKDAAQ